MRTKEQDRELFSVIKKELYTAAVTDVMDKMGYQHQFLPAEIRPLREEMIIVGRVRPLTALRKTTFMSAQVQA